MIKHSLIIPTFGRTDLVEQCINTFWNAHASQNSTEIIVVDDGSRDTKLRDWCDAAGKAGKIDHFISNSENKGFAHTVNTGLREAKGEYLTLVNNDIIFTQPILNPIEAAFNRDEFIGIVGAKLLYPNKTIQHAGLRYREDVHFFYHEYKHQRKDYRMANVARYVQAVTGALFSIKRETYEAIGAFDERFFLACEDAEYCVRAWDNDIAVFYSPNVCAIHAEGATRGNTVKAKERMGRHWYAKELQGIGKYQQELKNRDMNAVKTKVNNFNIRARREHREITQTPRLKKLEVGSGNNPQPGYLHLDVRRGLPQIDYVLDFSRQKLPVPDKSMEEVLANHVIEHISWRRLPFVIREWHRVLTLGGKLVLRTPNLKFICESYLAKIITKEHPRDEQFVTGFLAKTVTPSWWANIKLFSGQDYEANFHCCCFDFEMLRDLLIQYGFSEVNQVKFDREYSPGELQVEAIK